MLGAVTVIVASALGVLTGSPSKFEANDGNMVVDAMGNADWNSVAGTCFGGANVVNGTCTSGNYVHLTDVFSSTGDNSFQSGQKQDSACPVINTNKNPGKDDFTDVASFNETSFTAGPQFHHTFLYGATIRFTQNGSADENIELNKGTNGICAGTTDQLQRSAGDKLIAIDYTNGGKTVAFQVFTWVTSGTCFVGNDTAPCWGANPQSLSQSAAEGLANQAEIFPADNGINGQDLVTGQFAEFGVDLTAAGIIPAGSCASFPQTIWESRSSGNSFVANIEDVSVEKHTISNCGDLIVKKVTDPSPDPTDTSFSFAKTSTQDSINRTFSLKNGGSDKETVFAANDFSVTETVPANWTLTSASCDNGSGTLSGSTLSGIVVDIGKTTTCTFNDKLQTGAIKILKTSSKAAHTALAGATFLIKDPNGNTVPSSPSDSNGVVCVDGLTSLGDYTVQETGAPSGYDIDDSTVHTVTVTGSNAKCSDSSFGGQSLTFRDTPLTDIAASATSEVAGGTQSTITCTGTSTDGKSVLNSSDGPKEAASVSANGLHPGTYTCTLVIDP
jgi:hypothetical protein